MSAAVTHSLARFWAALVFVTSLLSLLGLLGACAPQTESAPKAQAPAPVVAVGRPAPSAGLTEEGMLPISPSDPVWGDRGALVTIVEIGDFQCPFCARASATLETIKRTYGPEKVRIVWKHLPLPFHPEARPAAEWSVAVKEVGGNDAFWKLHDKLFGNQMTLSASSYEEWTKDIGVDVMQVKRALESGAARTKVEADNKLMNELDVHGTPHFFVNGVEISGAQPIDKFKDVIDVELEKARVVLAAGTAREQLHAKMFAANFKKREAAREEKDDDEKDDPTVYKVPVGNSPVRGPADALVTVVVFSDFQCPFCKKLEPTLADIERRSPGLTMRVVWKDLPLPFHKRAEPAAQLAREARAQKGDAAFWAAHAKLFESAPALEDADLESIAKDLKLDVPKVMAAIKSHKHKAAIDADMKLADDFQAQGTPHMFINGKRAVGAMPIEALSPYMNEALSRANAAVKNGTPHKDVYETLVKDGAGAPEPEKRTVAWRAGAPAVGPANAPVTMIIFSDFQCPFCSRVLPTVESLKKEYGKRVRFVWRNLPLPFHTNAHIAAQAAMEAHAQKGDATFWKMHDLLFGNQRALERDALLEYGKKVGLDAKKLEEALDSKKHAALVDEDLKQANQAGIQGTPAFVIVPGDTKGATGNVTGYLVSGAQPVTKFKKLLDRALDDAKAGKKL